MPAPGVMKGVLGGIMSPLVKTAVKASHSPTEPLGRFLVDLAIGRLDSKLEGKGVEVLPGGFPVVNNVGLRRVAGLDN